MNLIPQKQVLSNGLTVLTLDIPSMQSATALLMVKVGSRYENNQIAGLSHFLEHMVFKGTKKYPNSLILSSTIDSIGAEFNAFTGKEYTGFYVKADSKHLNLALDVLSQMVWEPLLEQKEIDKEKGVIIEEKKMREDAPMLKIALDYESLLYGNTHLGREAIGTKESIQSISKDNFVDYRKQWYKPERMVLGIVGGLSSKPVLANFSSRFNKDNPCLSKDYPLQRLTFRQTKPQLKVKYKKTEQAHLCLGVRTFPRATKDRYVLAVLATILGGNMSSRLFMEVREKRGLAYYIKTDMESYFDNGYLVSQAGTDINKASEAIKVILEEYNKLSNCQITKLSIAELNKAKEFLKGRLALGLEDSKEIASLFVEDLLLEGKIRTVQTIIKGIDKVSLADIQRVAKTIFVNGGLNLAIIGPFDNEEIFKKVLVI